LELDLKIISEGKKNFSTHQYTFRLIILAATHIHNDKIGYILLSSRPFSSRTPYLWLPNRPTTQNFR